MSSISSRAVAAARGSRANGGADSSRSGSGPRLLVRKERSLRFIRTDDVRWVEADGNYIRVHAHGESYRMRGTLAAATEKLGADRFMRIHRSSSVNLDHVAEICPWFSGDYLVVLNDGTRLRMSRSYRKELETRFGLLE